MVTDRERMRAAVNDVKNLHRIGAESLRRRPGKAGYASGELEAEALRAGINADTMRKARAFAHPVSGYTTKELMEFCEAIRQNWPKFASKNAAVGPSHVILLVSAPKKQGMRARVQARMFAGGWSTSVLQAELLRQFGRRKKGGRKAELGGTIGDVLLRLDQYRESWIRLSDELDGRDERNEAAGNRALPTRIQSAVSKIVRQMRNLGGEIPLHLKSCDRKRL